MSSSVLVIPAAGDPYGLLAGGCGSRAPKVYRDPDGDRWRDWGHVWHAAALPLWWDGRLVPEGWDRARRALWTKDPAHLGRLLSSFSPGLGGIRRVCDRLLLLSIASRIVLLDEQGVERPFHQAGGKACHGK